ncbi:putative reverse transcriptase domain-containing protein [Tanacetum coccineum]
MVTVAPLNGAILMMTARRGLDPLPNHPVAVRDIMPIFILQIRIRGIIRFSIGCFIRLLHRDTHCQDHYSTDLPDGFCYLADVEVDPSEVRLGVDVEDESFEQSRSRGTDLEVDEMLDRRVRQSLTLNERIAELVRDNKEGLKAPRECLRVRELTDSRKENKGGNGGGNEIEGNGENGNEIEMENLGYDYGGFLGQWPIECILQGLLEDSALTWWNSYKRTIGVDVAYAMNWAELMRMVPDEEGYAARSAENKRRMESNPRDNRGQQPPFKRQNISGQNVARAYTAGNNERKGYGWGAAVGNQQGIGCYECGRPGHFRKDCPKLRSQNRGNQARNKSGNKTGNQTGGNGVTAKAYAIGGGGTNPDSNVVTGTFLLNNCYVTMLFDSGADRSFVSSTFSALLNAAPSTLDNSYVVELAD